MNNAASFLNSINSTEFFGFEMSFNSAFIVVGGQASCLIALSHFMQLILKPFFGHPTPFIQILAGFVLGPSGLSRIPAVSGAFALNSTYFGPLSRLCRMLFVFFIGLEMDIPYLMGNFRSAAICAIGGILTCTVFGGALAPLIYWLDDSQAVRNMSVHAYIIASISTAATPLVVFTAAELKIENSDIGRLAIHSSLINDILCLLLVDMANVIANRREMVSLGFGYLFATIVILVATRFGATWLNRGNRNQKYITNAQVFCILATTIGFGAWTEIGKFDSTVPCFLMGLMFPRGGKTARTILHKLGSSLGVFIMPIYFGSVGFRADMRLMTDFKHYAVLLVAVLSSIGGKICGIVGACQYLNIPLSQVAILPIFLGLKIYVDLPMIIPMITPNTTQKLLNFELYLHILTAIIAVVNSVILGPVITFIVRRDRSLAYDPKALEEQNPENELRVVACVHSPRHVSTMMWLIGASSASRSKPTIPCLMHLIELPDRPRAQTKNLMSYHQLDMEELDDDDYGGSDVVLVNDALDNFVAETGIMVRQVKVVRPPSVMYEDVCRVAEDTRASILLLPFHKHQRIDGKMEQDKEDIRTTNQKVLRNAPCTVAILIDRGLAGAPQILTDSHMMQHVATIFFGGPDDREALAYGIRICRHPQVNLTVIRFQPRASRRHDPGIDVASSRDVDDLLMEISVRKNETDDVFITNFYNRYVTTGMVGYVERYADTGVQTAQALKDTGEMYSLFIVGRGGRGHLRMASELSDWEECPELGPIGDLLASSDFFLTGSVLVIQQCKPLSKGHEDEEDDEI